MGKAATVRSGTINLLNTIVGAGILAMPYGLKANGLAFGCILVVWSSLTSSMGLYLQSKVAKYTSQTEAVSYFSLAQLTYPQFSIVFDLAIAIKCFGVGVSYLVVIGDLMPKIMELLGVIDTSILMRRNLWITLFMALLVVPLSYLKKLDSLRYTSVVALFLVVYLICLVVFHYFANDIALDPGSVKNIDYWGPISVRSTLSSFPIFVFAYTCHQNMFAIINELKPRMGQGESGSKTRQSNLIIRNSIATACCSYLVVGVIGYLSFGTLVNGNIITMYPRDLVLSLIGRLSIVIMVSLLFPLQCHPCRGLVNHVYYYLTQGFKQDQNGGPQLRHHPSVIDSAGRHGTTSSNEGSSTSEREALTADTESLKSLVADDSFISTTPLEGAQDTDGHGPAIVPLTSKRFYVITTCIVTFSYLVAVTVTSLEHVLAFVGSTGSTSILFILPGLFGYLLIKPLDGGSVLSTNEKFCKYGGLALAIWGVIVMVVCLSATIFLNAAH